MTGSVDLTTLEDQRDYGGFVERPGCELSATDGMGASGMKPKEILLGELMLRTLKKDRDSANKRPRLSY